MGRPDDGLHPDYRRVGLGSRLKSTVQETAFIPHRERTYNIHIQRKLTEWKEKERKNEQNNVLRYYLDPKAVHKYLPG